MESYRITRCKMGFRSIADLPEFMILMEFRDMAQMDEAFKRVAPLEGELEVKHKSFNQFVAGDIQHALFRDWPDQFWYFALSLPLSVLNQLVYTFDCIIWCIINIFINFVYQLKIFYYAPDSVYLISNESHIKVINA